MATVKPITMEYVSNLKNGIILDTIHGNYLKVRKASRELASIGVQDFNLVKNANCIKIGHIPPFTKPSFNILKISMLNFFRIKTKDEKEFKRLVREENIRENYKKQVRQQIESSVRQDIDGVIKKKTDELVNAKVDELMRFIPQFTLDTFSEAAVSKNGKDIRSEINASIKEIPAGIIRENRKEVNRTIFNPKFLKDSGINF